MKERSLAASVAALILACGASSGMADEAQRTAAYTEYRSAFDARRYAEALPIAERVVQLTEAQSGADDRALVNPLTNLGTTQYRLKSYDAAQEAYTRALAILDSKAAAADRQFIRPLHGLGATYFAVGRYEDSVLVLKRAVDISRNLDGLFNPAQLEMLRPLIASYDALHRFEDTAKEQQYAYTIAETSFGKDDPRLLPALDSYARWHESVGRYTLARMLHGQAVSLAEKIGGRGTPLSVEGLRGISRTYRLTYIYGESQEKEQPTVTEATAIAAIGPRTLSPSADGERALRAAAQILQAQKPVDARHLGETLVDLGDWYMLLGGDERAMATWKGAWKNLESAGGTQLLETPAALNYRAPSIAASRRPPDEDYEVRTVQVTLDVSRRGEADNVVRTGGDAAEGQQRPVLTAVRRALYRPRFEAGEPVDTKGFVVSESVSVKRPKAQ